MTLRIGKIILWFAVFLLLVPMGCQEGGRQPERKWGAWWLHRAVRPGFQVAEVRLHRSFTYIDEKEENEPGRIEVYLTLHDQYGDPFKAQGEFRFEIFQYQPAASDPRGGRFSVHGMQEFDLIKLDVNQKHWDGTTRNYRFSLALPELTDKQKPIVLQVTFTDLSKIRFEDMLVLERDKLLSYH